MHLNNDGAGNCTHIKDMKFLTTAEAAAILLNSPVTIRRKINKGLINAIRLSTRGEYRIDEREIQRVITKPQHKPVSINWNVLTTEEALTSEHIATILKINKDVAAQHMRNWLDTENHRSLRISQKLFLKKLIELQTIYRD